jgi:hypothetical protein
MTTIISMNTMTMAITIMEIMEIMEIMRSMREKAITAKENINPIFY